MASVEEIKRKVDIVDLVGDVAALKQSGKNFKANCPFHNERTPSFYVFPDRQGWHCFGACGTGGDIFSFVMRRDGVEFREALRILARRAGVEIEDSGIARKRASEVQVLRETHKAAAMFFHEALLKDKDAQHARDYVKRRGLSQETVEDYRIGYASDQAAPLVRYMEHQGFDDKALLDAGLLRTRDERAGAYPFFRNRLIIPIQDAEGDFIGFGARALDESNPKYLNSAQSEAFDKSSVLYGLHQGQEAVKAGGSAVLVEGYMDVLMAHQHGFKNVIAAMGTALTDKHLHALRRIAKTFILALDPDAAGDEATLRGLEATWKVMDQAPVSPMAAQLTSREVAQPLVLQVMRLPRGKDPDEVIKESPVEWKRLVDVATPIVDYVFEALINRFDVATPAGKQAVVIRLAPMILHSSNVFEQNHRIKKLADLLREDENVVRLAIRAPASRDPRRRAQKPALPSSPKMGHDPQETYCIAMVLRYPELLALASDLGKSHFSTASLQEIYGRLVSGAHAEDLRELLPGELEPEINTLLEYPLFGNYHEREEGLREVVRRLKERRIKMHIEVLQTLVAEDGGADADTAARAEELRHQLLHLQRNSG